MPSAYAQAGVDIVAGELAVELMKDHVRAASRPEVIGGIGGFAGLFDASGLCERFRHPVLATSTDGVGTKVDIAREMGIYDTVGWDLVAMVVDDLVVIGAEPLFMTDYIACGSVVPERVAAIVKGIAQACAHAGVALIGGETAEHPGLLAPDEFDLAGAATGVVEKDEILGAHKVAVGDHLVCLASSGLHSNGYSLVRKVLLEQAGLTVDARIEGWEKTLGEVLLTPTIVYAADCLSVVREVEVHAMSHVTGGGLANNLARVIPDHVSAVIDRGTWKPDPIFSLIQDRGGISQGDMEESLNMGVGMVLVCPESSVARACAILAERGLRAWDAGMISARQSGADPVTLVGDHDWA